jgi:hypothetical protein
MNSRKQFLVAASAFALSIGAANPAFAQATTVPNTTLAGTDIDNTVTVNYQVGGVDQTEETASDTFQVDRVINLTVAASDNATTSVSPGQNDSDTPPPVTTFVVTNTSNEVLDFQLAVANQGGGAAPNGGTDNFDVGALQIFVDNGDGIYNPADDTQTFIDELGVDANVTVFVIGSIPNAQVNGDVAAVTLTATAREGGTVGGTVGAAITEDTGADTDGIETVFADGAGDTDANRDGSFSATDDYTVQAADITVRKISTVISDPVNGTTNPKAIPGAVVEYCIAIGNASGVADASSITISDPLLANITYDSSFGNLLNGTITGDIATSFTCNADGAAGGSFASNTVTGTIPTVAAGDARTLVFRVTVD